jgi:hypothetical protein
MADKVFSCSICGDVIGMYEPLIVVEEHQARQTSRAAEPALTRERGIHYHRDCYAARGLEQTPIKP